MWAGTPKLCDTSHSRRHLGDNFFLKSCKRKMLMARPNVVIGSESVKGDVIAEKVSQDIAFLTDRLERLKRSSTPNPQVLKIYQDMLESREAVLAWLHRG